MVNTVNNKDNYSCTIALYAQKSRKWLMGESETISWIKSQLNAGYSSPQIKEMLMNSGYEPENAEKMLDLAAGQNSGSGNSAPIAVGSDSAHEQKDDVHEESWIKVGGDAGVCASVVFVVVFLTLVFFDKIVSNIMYVSFLGVILIGAFIISNRNAGASIKKIMGSAFVCSLILASIYAILALFFGNHIFNLFNPNMYYSSKQDIMSIGIAVVVICGIIGIIVLLEISSLIMRFVLKRVNVARVTVLKQIMILGVLYFLGMGLFCFTGPKITHELIDVYWCDGDKGELCEMEKRDEDSFIKATGYSFESYFTQAPNINNRFAMNIYEVATLWRTHINILSIDTQNQYVVSKYDEMNLYEEYYNTIFKGNERDFLNHDGFILIIDNYNLYLNNLKKMIETYEIDYTDKYSMFKDKEQHLEYIQTKIDINNGLKRSYESMELYNEIMMGTAELNYYGVIKDDVRHKIFTQYTHFEHSAFTKIKIKNVSFKEVQNDATNKKIEIEIENNGIYYISKQNVEDFLFYVNYAPVNDVTCEFVGLDINEEGTCSGLIRDDGSYPKEIKVTLPRGHGSTYLYEKE